MTAFSSISAISLAQPLPPYPPQDGQRPTPVDIRHHIFEAFHNDRENTDTPLIPPHVWELVKAGISAACDERGFGK